MAPFRSLSVFVLVVLGVLLVHGSAAESTVSFNLTSSGLLGYNYCVPLKSGGISMPSQAVAMGVSLLPDNQYEHANDPKITAHYYSLFGNSSVGNEYSMVGQINFATVAAAATANVPELYVTPCFSSTAVPGGACTGPFALSKLLNSSSIHNFAGRTLLDIKLFFYNSTVVGKLLVEDIGSDFWLCVAEELLFNARVTFVFQ